MNTYDDKFRNLFDKRNALALKLLRSADKDTATLFFAFLKADSALNTILFRLKYLEGYESAANGSDRK